MTDKKKSYQDAQTKVKGKKVKPNTKVAKSDSIFVQIFNSIFYGRSKY